MKKIILTLTAFLLGWSAQAQTLDECQRAAQQHYPQIRQYGLIEKTTQLTLSNIAKGWLPQISASAQATYQSDVTAWPDEMRGMMQQMGVHVKGLSKDQYRVGLDVQQMVYDGGAMSAQQAVARAKGAAESQQVTVNRYALRERVNEMYFSLLLLSEQITLNHDLQQLLAANEQRLAAMVKRGTAAESDWQSVKAEQIVAQQQGISLTSQREMLEQLLTAFCGIEVKQPSKPTAPSQSVGANVQRPELRAFDAQQQVLEAQEKVLKSSLMPKLGLFAQGYYGYPGLNMFEDMMQRRWSLNGIVGAKLTWNLSALYTHKNDKAKLQQQWAMVENQRETFLYNHRLAQTETTANLARTRRLHESDEALLQLRTAVRKASESKLAHGIIAVSDLLRDINAENAARVQLSIHEIETLKQQHQQQLQNGLEE